jgi:hypothetical protein
MVYASRWHLHEPRLERSLWGENSFCLYLAYSAGIAWGMTWRVVALFL